MKTTAILFAAMVASTSPALVSAYTFMRSIDLPTANATSLPQSAVLPAANATLSHPLFAVLPASVVKNTSTDTNGTRLILPANTSVPTSDDDDALGNEDNNDKPTALTDDDDDDIDHENDDEDAARAIDDTTIYDVDGLPLYH